MPIRTDAYVLLTKPWKPDFEGVAHELEARFPEIGKCRARRGSGDQGGSLLVEGAPVEISFVSAPYPAEQLHPPIKVAGRDPTALDRLTSSQIAYALVSSTCQSEELEWARAHAALVTLAAVAVARQAKAQAVFWPESWCCLAPKEFEKKAREVIAGRPPIDLWCAFARLNPAHAGGEGMTGVASLGLRRMLGREIEIAPMPGEEDAILELAREAARRALSGEWLPRDGDTFQTGSGEMTMTVRMRDEGFLRPGIPAAVLVAPEAAVDAGTLERDASVKAPDDGKGRLFGRFRRRG